VPVLTTSQIMQNAWRQRTVVPAFSTPYLPMMEPIVAALRDCGAFGLIQVARLEWTKFEAKSLAAVRDEYRRVADERHTRLHVDHVPVIDEDNQRVDYQRDIREAIELGYQSVMVDGSRLPLDENIAATRNVVVAAHEAGIPVEAELGAVFGHEEGPMPSYDELFATGKGFTDPDEAKRLIDETGADWLSVAIGNIHGAISPARKSLKKIQARLNIEQLDRIAAATDVPLVLHGGSGIPKARVLDAVRHGIAKINVCATNRQAYEGGLAESPEKARHEVYETTRRIIREDFKLEGSAAAVNPV